MTIQVNVDGHPFLVIFSGSVEIERMGSSLDIAIRKAGDNSKVWGVAFDAEEANRRREVIRMVENRMGGISEFWHGRPPCVMMGMPRQYPWKAKA